MTIDRLEQAASAAGFAMAAPDDWIDEAATAPKAKEAVGRGLIVQLAPTAIVSRPASEALTTATNWFRGHLPAAHGGRATA
jgi:hypothetical protein